MALNVSNQLTAAQERLEAAQRQERARLDAEKQFQREMEAAQQEIAALEAAERQTEILAAAGEYETRKAAVDTAITDLQNVFNSVLVGLDKTAINAAVKSLEDADSDSRVALAYAQRLIRAKGISPTQKAAYGVPMKAGLPALERAISGWVMSELPSTRPERERHLQETLTVALFFAVLGDLERSRFYASRAR